MRREILVTTTPQESWVAIVEDGQLVQIMLDRPDQGRMVGDIVLGRVEAVLPGIQAAFVDIGREKAGFLHASDLGSEEEEDEEGDGGGSDANGSDGNGSDGNGRSGRRSRSYPPIQDKLRKGQEILVQVTKEPIGTKGPRLTAEVSLPGRFMVYMPFSSHVGISRKIEDRGERRRLREMAREMMPPDSGGMIVRTVGEEVNRKTLEEEFRRLHSTWEEIRKRARGRKAPSSVHREARLVSGVIRDLFSDKFEALTVDSREIYDEIVEYVRGVDPDLLGRVGYHEGEVPLFDEFGIEEEMQKAFARKVVLPSGGHIVIEPTEALVTIDVNTGRFTGKGRKDPEETILKTNLDAAREIAKQLRLRDIGGIIVADFIDMESQENRDRVLHELRSHLGRDRARTKTFEVSELGLVEMTRQRVRPSLFQSLTDLCEHCGGTGRVYTPATVLRRIERSVRRVASSGDERSLVVRLHPEVALRILEEEPDFLRRMRNGTDLDVELRDDPVLRQDQFRLVSGPAETDVTERYTRH